MSQRVIIIDDEPNGIKTLKVLIERHTPGLKVVATSSDPIEGIELIENYKPDVVFLDISMPKMNGFELLDKLDYRDFKLVFTTAHQEYALKAIKNKAFDYLLKPIDIEELIECAQRLTSNERSLRSKTNSIVELHVKDGILFIKKEEIVRLEASGSYTTFFLDNGVKHVASKNLKECESLIAEDSFFRCHPSHLVNLKKVIRIVSTDGLFAKMSDGSTAEIMRKNKDVFIERLKSL